MRKYAPLFLLALTSGCAGLPSLDKVQYSFYRKQPDCTIIRVEGQITNRLYAQFQIYYLKPGDSREHMDVWNYHHAAEFWVKGKRESIR